MDEIGDSRRNGVEDNDDVSLSLLIAYSFSSD